MKDIMLCQLIHLTVTDVLFMFSKICPPVSHRVGRLGCSQTPQSCSRGAGCPRDRSVEEIRCGVCGLFKR